MPNITEPVSITTLDVSKSHTNGKELPLIVIQTQTKINDSHVDSDDKEIPMTESSDGPQFDEIAKRINNVFDNTDGYLSAELKAVNNHRYFKGVFEFQVEYIK